MVCPMCVAASVIGGGICGLLGIKVPKHKNALLVSTIITVSLLVFTTIALKSIFNLSICQGNRLNLKAIALLAAFNLPLGVIYSIGVNYLLGRFVYPSPCPVNPSVSSCCCSKASK